MGVKGEAAQHDPRADQPCRHGKQKDLDQAFLNVWQGECLKHVFSKSVCDGLNGYSRMRFVITEPVYRPLSDKMRIILIYSDQSGGPHAR